MGGSGLLKREAVILLADVGPNLIALDGAGGDVLDRIFHDGHAVVADADQQSHDGVAMDASHALDGTDRTALGEGGDDLNLLIAGQDVHGANP